MNYTSKHHLPQWEKTDRILMEDFNLAMANIETGLSSAGDGAALSLYLGFRPSFLILTNQSASPKIGRAHV